MQRVAEVFTRARHLSGMERSLYLGDSCVGDAALRREVESLLAELDSPSPVDTHAVARAVHVVALSTASSLVPDSAGAPPDRIGRFRILRVLGEGGMGTVYEADQLEPVQRRVALKVIRIGMDSRDVLARFDTERQALAVMSHPNIACVFDAGSTADGRPWFAMELVPGVAITRFCDERRLTTRRRLELFLPACQAVQHAHQKGVIHRDLKPANILVAEQNGRAEPRVIDFGVAKATGTELTEQSHVTQLGCVIGTPDYMSPEQAEGSRLDVDTRTDVYSLGVVLYELLSGELPFDRATMPAREWLQKLASGHTRAPKPSSRVSTLEGEKAADRSRARGVSLRALSRGLSGDLDWIVLKAMAPERSRRYETASALAADIQRYLDGEPVEARPPTVRYRLGKFVRRHRAGVAAAAILALALAAFTGALAVQSARLRRQRDAARAAEEVANRTIDTYDRQVNFLMRSFLSRAREERAPMSAQELRDLVAERARDELKADPDTRVRILESLALLHHYDGREDKAEPIFREVLEYKRQSARTDRFSLAETLTGLALALRTKGDPHSALPLGVEAAAIALKALEPAPETGRILEGAPSNAAISLINLGNFLYDLGDLPAARRTYEGILALRAQAGYTRFVWDIGPDYELTSLARTLRAIGDVEGANNLTNRALVHARTGRPGSYGAVNAIPSRQVPTLVLRYLGTLHLDRDPLAACAFSENALARDRVSHEPPFQVGLDLGGIGNSLREMGDLESAKATLEQALSFLLASLSPEHHQVALALRDLAIVSRDRGDLGHARLLLEQVHGIQLATFGPDHPETATTLGQLGGVLREQGNLAGARPLLADALATLRRVRGPEHPDVASTLIHLGKLHRATGDLPRARPLLEQALAIRRKSSGPGNLDMAAALDDLASLHQTMGDGAAARTFLDEAVPMYRQALAMRARSLGPDHPGATRLRAVLADALRRAGNSGPASTYR